jgi:YidC/Oxa1 family membrane protein insertase
VNDQRNMILAVVLSALVLFGWTAVSEKFFPQPKPVVAPAAPAATAGGVPVAAPTAAATIRDRAIVIGESARVQINTPKLKGSIALKGARFDDLVLVEHKQTIKKNSGPVQLLSPAGTQKAYFAGFGWSGDGLAAPDANTVWTADNAVLTPEKPVTLNWANANGQRFAIKISVDKDYMFAIDQTVVNAGTGAVGARSYAYVSRNYGAREGSMFAGQEDVDIWTLHVGPIGTFNDAANYDTNYGDLDEAGAAGKKFNSRGGWLGFGDSYWLTALIPGKDANVRAAFRKDGGIYQAEYAQDPALVAPGKSVTTSSRFFAGAKEVGLLDTYEKTGGVQLFGKAIDWGWFEIFAKPIFYVLDWLFKLTNNFGVAIIGLTLIVKGLMFPIAQKQFASMAGMRAVQPKIQALQERYKDDKVKLQQETLALYQKEKINPAAGCLPIFIQIPVFYALYKVLLLTIEMRHQPFALWIKDLSAPDPATPINLFGLLPFTPPSMIAIGVLPIVVGVTMYIQQKLNPAPADPVQAQVFAVMPWMLMFIMAPFAAGLQLYWACNNTLTILQQKWLYSRHPGMQQAAATAKPK